MCFDALRLARAILKVVAPAALISIKPDYSDEHVILMARL
jgi:hypothetical protein